MGSKDVRSEELPVAPLPAVRIEIFFCSIGVVVLGSKFVDVEANFFWKLHEGEGLLRVGHKLQGERRMCSA